MTDASPQRAPDLAPEPRVALLLDTRAWAGTEAYVRDLALGLRDLGAAVIVACAPSSPLWKRARASGLRTAPIARRGTNDPATVLSLTRALRRGSIDIIHAHNGRTSLAAVLAVKLSGRGAVVATQHFLEPAHATRTGLKARLSNGVHGWVARGIAHTIAISRAAQDASLARGDVDASKISVVLNGAAAPTPDPSTSREEKRAAWGAGPEDFLIACVARLEEEKSIETLLEALAILRQSVPNAKCVVAGEGAQREALQVLAERLKLGPSLQMPGFISSAADLMAASDVCVLPSVAEPFGLAVVEAMAMARPVVATAAGGPLEIVRPGETGLLVSPRSPREMAEALEELHADPTRAEEMGRRGREVYEASFTVERMAREVREVYRQVWARDKS